MSTVNDVDMNALVQKYLDRQVTTPKLDRSANSGDEVTAVLEAVAVTLLLYPQAALPIILRSKNSLQQIAQEDIKFLDLITHAIDDINNPDNAVTDSSDLVEAQIALIELGRLGKVEEGVQSYDRYNTAVNRFLDNQLAKSLKRHSRIIDGSREFERSGTEARQDILQALVLFQAAHQAVIQRRKELLGSIADFQSVDLTRIVSNTTLARVRSSIQQIIKGIQQQNLSKTVMALELLSGAASLRSISNVRGIYDPLVNTLQKIPDGRTITLSSDLPAATALSSTGPWDINVITPWNFTVAVDGAGPVSYELPSAGATGKVFLTSTIGGGTYNIPASSKLFVRVEEGSTITDLAITLTTGGAVLFSQLVTDINTGMGVKGTCQALFGGSNRFILLGAGTVTRLSIISSDTGFVDGGGVYHAPNPSAHLILGFANSQVSPALGIFTPRIVQDLLGLRVAGVGFTLENGLLRLTSQSASITSRLVFTGATAGTFGLVGIYAMNPLSLGLQEDGVDVTAASLNILTGALVVSADVAAFPEVRGLASPINTINEGILAFTPGTLLPRGAGLPAVITSAMVIMVQQLMVSLAALPPMDNDFFDLQKVLSPLLGKPTLAQVNDAKRALQDVKTKLTGTPGLIEVLQASVVRDDQTNFKGIADTILQTLEERGLDRAEDLLKRGLFSQFFSLTKEAASRSGRFLNAIEKIGQTDLASTTVEADLPEGNTIQGTGPENTLQGKEPSS